jgi:hypothetical protein
MQALMGSPLVSVCASKTQRGRHSSQPCISHLSQDKQMGDKGKGVKGRGVRGCKAAVHRALGRAALQVVARVGTKGKGKPLEVKRGSRMTAEPLCLQVP